MAVAIILVAGALTLPLAFDHQMADAKKKKSSKCVGICRARSQAENLKKSDSLMPSSADSRTIIATWVILLALISNAF